MTTYSKDLFISFIAGSSLPSFIIFFVAVIILFIRKEAQFETFWESFSEPWASKETIKKLVKLWMSFFGVLGGPWEARGSHSRCLCNGLHVTTFAQSQSFKDLGWIRVTFLEAWGLLSGVCGKAVCKGYENGHKRRQTLVKSEGKFYISDK